MLWFDTVCWYTHYGFLHISLKPHSSPMSWFPVSMEVWACLTFESIETAFDLYKLEALSSGKAYVNTLPRTETVNNIFSLYMCREVISTYTCVEKSFLHEVTYHSQVGRSPLRQGKGEVQVLPFKCPPTIIINIQLTYIPWVWIRVASLESHGLTHLNHNIII